jgi:hypothetical protein
MAVGIAIGRIGPAIAVDMTESCHPYAIRRRHKGPAKKSFCKDRIAILHVPS